MQRGPITEQDGRMTFAYLKWLQSVETRLADLENRVYKLEHP